MLELSMSWGVVLSGVGQSLHQPQEEVAEEGESFVATVSLPVAREHLHTQMLVDVEVLREERRGREDW